MSLRKILVVTAILGLPWGPSWASPLTFVDTFEDGVNMGGWSWSIIPEDDPGPAALRETGGNPGWFARWAVAGVDGSGPSIVARGSPFVGDYQTRRVVEIGVDLHVFRWGGPNLSTEPLHLVLGTDSGTPDDLSDDYRALFVGQPEHAKPDLRVWQTVTFTIDSGSETLPDGWSLISRIAGSTIPPDPTWSQLITNVSSVQFFWDLPVDSGGGFGFSGWDVAIDNASITEVPEPISPLLLLIAFAPLWRRRR